MSRDENSMGENVRVVRLSLLDGSRGRRRRCYGRVWEYDSRKFRPYRVHIQPYYVGWMNGSDLSMDISSDDPCRSQERPVSQFLHSHP